MCPGRLLALEGQEAQDADLQGIIATIPLWEKSRENPCIRGSSGGKGVLEDTFSGPRTVWIFPAKAPTPGPLILTEEPDPGKV